MLWIGGIIAAEYLCSWQPHFLGSRSDYQSGSTSRISDITVHPAFSATYIFAPQVSSVPILGIVLQSLYHGRDSVHVGWIRRDQQRSLPSERHQVILRFRRNIFFESAPDHFKSPGCHVNWVYHILHQTVAEGFVCIICVSWSKIPSAITTISRHTD